MAKIFLFNMVSLDGYFEGENHNITWHNVDAEFNQYAIEQTKSVGLFLFGRRTYELMSGYWPTEQARKSDPVVAELMNTTPKIVFSRTMEKLQEIPYWENARLMKDVNVEYIQELKLGSEKDIAIYGSNNLCINLAERGLIDEFRVMINPVVLGKGTPLFFGLNKKLKLKLLNQKVFKSGNVLLYYRPES